MNVGLGLGYSVLGSEWDFRGCCVILLPGGVGLVGFPGNALWIRVDYCLRDWSLLSRFADFGGLYWLQSFTAYLGQALIFTSADKIFISGSLHNSYIPCLLLIIMLRFTCGERKYAQL